MKFVVVEFNKGAWETGERTVLEKFPELCEIKAIGEGFTWETQDRARDIMFSGHAWDEACRMMDDPSFRLVLLDELNICLRYDYLPIDEVIAKLQTKRPCLHAVITGRKARAERIAIADIV